MRISAPQAMIMRILLMVSLAMAVDFPSNCRTSALYLGSGFVTYLGSAALSLDNVGQQNTDGDHDEDQGGRSYEGQSPAVDEGDDNGSDHGGVELDKGTKLFRNTKLQRVARRGDGGGGEAGGH